MDSRDTSSEFSDREEVSKVGQRGHCSSLWPNARVSLRVFSLSMSTLADFWPWSTATEALPLKTWPTTRPKTGCLFFKSAWGLYFWSENDQNINQSIIICHIRINQNSKSKNRHEWSNLTRKWRRKCLLQGSNPWRCALLCQATLRGFVLFPLSSALELQHRDLFHGLVQTRPTSCALFTQTAASNGLDYSTALSALPVPRSLF